VSMENPALPPDDSPVPDRSQELVDYALDWMQSSAIKVMSTKLLPLILGSGVAASALAWLQDEVGINLNPTAVAALVGSIVVGAIVMAFAYVRNHGRGASALGVALVELEKLREAGRQYQPELPLTTAAPEDVPPLPPGISGDAR
jgi:hypothetical protein